MLNAILWEALAPDDGQEEKELYAELERRRKAYKAGKIKSLTLDEVKARYLRRKKKRKS